MRSIRLLAPGIALVALLCGDLIGQAPPAPAAQEKFRPIAEGIPGKYVVVLSEGAAGPIGPSSGAPELAASLSALYGGRVEFVYTHVLGGFAVEASEQVALNISRDLRVAYVEQAVPVRQSLYGPPPRSSTRRHGASTVSISVAGPSTMPIPTVRPARAFVPM